MDLSIIIVNYGSGRLVKACVDSIRRSPPSADPPPPSSSVVHHGSQEGRKTSEAHSAGFGEASAGVAGRSGAAGSPAELHYEIIVVDNASPDDSQELLATEVPGIRFFPQRTNQGYAQGVNVGIAAARGEFLLILNPDIIVLEGALNTLLQFAQEHPQAAVFAGQLLNPTGSVQDSCFRFYTPFTILARRTPLGMLPFGRRHVAKALLKDIDHAVARPVDWVLGACMLVRRKAATEVGPMDGRFFLYFEDMDWCRRFWEAGHEVWYVPAARFAHYYKRASAQEAGVGALLQPITRTHIASGFKYFWKYRGRGLVPTKRVP